MSFPDGLPTGVPMGQPGGPVPEGGVTAFLNTGTERIIEGGSAPEGFGVPAIPEGFMGGAPEMFNDGIMVVNKEGANTNIHVKLLARPLSTGAEKTFTRVPIFIYNPERRDYGSGEFTVFSLDQLNWSMRQAAFYQAMDATDAMRGKRKQTDDQAMYASFPRSVEEFCEAFVYLGWVYGERYETDDAARIMSPESSIFNVCTKGEVHDVACYWHGENLTINDQVGFRVCLKTLGDGPDRSWDGEKSGLTRMSRNTPVIQIEPWHDQELGGFPLGGDFQDVPRPVRQKNGAIVNVALYQPARTILVGHVQRTKRSVQPHEVSEALVGRKGVEFLLRNNKVVDLILMPQTSQLVV